MNQESGKRRARFKRGFEPPPLTPMEKTKVGQLRVKSPPRPLPSDDEIRERWVESNLRFLAQAEPDFWAQEIKRHLCYPSDFLGKLRLGKHRDSYAHILKACKLAVFPKAKTFDLDIEYPKDDGVPKVTINPHAHYEWDEIMLEAQGLIEMEPKPRIPTQSSILLDWVSIAGKNPPQTVPTELTKNWSMYDAKKAVSYAQRVEPRLVIVTSGLQFKIKLLAEVAGHLVLPAINKPLSIPMGKEFTKRDLEAFNTNVYSLILESAPNPSDDCLVLLRTRSKVELIQFLGGIPDAYRLDDFLCEAHLKGFALSWQLSCGAWIIWVTPDEGVSWDEAGAALDAYLRRKPSRELYGLSLDAAKLFDWLESLSPEEFEHRLSPVIEDHLKYDLGFDTEWEPENLHLLSELLCEEITEKTPFEARAYVWNHYNSEQTRIRFRSKKE